jgi:hypothetical protein
MSRREALGPRRVAVRRARAATRRNHAAAIRPTTVKWKRKLSARGARARRRQGNQTLGGGQRRVEPQAPLSVASRHRLQRRTPVANPTVRGRATRRNPALRPSAEARGGRGTPRRRALRRPRASMPRRARSANHGVRVREARTRSARAADLLMPGTLVLAAPLEAPLAPRSGRMISPTGPAVQQLLVGRRPQDRGAREPLPHGTGIARGTA